MKHLLTAIVIAFLTQSASAGDPFAEADRANKAFWRKGESTLWKQNAPDRSALINAILDDDEFEAVEEYDQPLHYEADYRDHLCSDMDTEVTLPNGARADCLSDTHAIKVEFSDKWAEGLGQALSYAASTDLRPGIFLICRAKPQTCLTHRSRLDEAIAAWKLPVDVWTQDE